jgi:methyl-accepting chemotaxis protein
MTTETKYGGRAHPKRQNFRRRQYLVDRKQQLATTVRVAGLVLILLLTLNAVIAWQSYTVTTQIMSTDPDIGERLHIANIRNIAVLAGISLIIFAMVIVRSIMLTHRTFGAVIKISQCLEEVADGNFEVALKLRSEDSLKALEEPFNEMTEMLRLQAKDDQKAMEKLADEVEGHDNPVDAEMLRRLAEARGKTSE